MAYVCSGGCSRVSGWTRTTTRLAPSNRSAALSVIGPTLSRAKFAHAGTETQLRLRPPFVSTNGALEPATIAAGDPFVKQVNPILGVIVLLSAAPNDDTAPPTPRGQALTPTHPRLTVVPHL